MKARIRGTQDDWQDIAYVQLKDNYALIVGDQLEFEHDTFEWTISEGYTAKIEDGKVIIKKTEAKPFEIKAGHWYMCINNKTDFGVISFTEGKVYQSNKDNYLPNDSNKKCSITVDAEKYFRPATKDEIPHKSKFKTGDFIIDMEDHEVFQVTKVRDNTYEIVAIDDGAEFDMPHDTVEDNYRLWTIQDAKDGDVLVYNNILTEIILIFRKLRGNGSAFTYAHIFGDEIGIDDWCDFGKDAHPATQEQRNLFFEKMVEIGYKWNTEKKELNKIQNSNRPEDEIPQEEPKFKVGDWITHQGTNNVYQVKSILGNQYLLKYSDNYTVQKCTDADMNCRLWTVQDDTGLGTCSPG